MDDITRFAALDTATITLRHPATDEPLVNPAGEPYTITLYGPGTKQHQAARAARERRATTAAMAAFGPKGKQPAAASGNANRAEVAAELAACTKSIGGWGYCGKADAEAIEAAYADPKLAWVADQVTKALNDWATFLPEQPAS
jgi:hypothetical protein